MINIIDIDPANVDTDGFAAGLTGAGPWGTSDFVQASCPDGLAHQLSLTSAANLSAITITVTGTDPDGNAISEAITGPNINTVEGAKYFQTIATVTASATLGANTLDIGWPDELATQVYPLRGDLPVPAGFFQLDVTGTISVDVQFFIPDPLDSDNFTETSLVPVVVDADLNDEAADVSAYIEEYGYYGFRVVLNSYTDTAEVQVYHSQAADSQPKY